MRIRTITCHDVDNHGASLQAYALVTYLQKQGHDAAIINYKPAYQYQHCSLKTVANPKYDKPVLKWIYLGLKMPGRLKTLHSKNKKCFDGFREHHLPLTRLYHTFDELREDPPDADVYLAGSDQIWNTAFENGRDPAFYLDFAPKDRIRASYAASFAAEHADPACAADQARRIGELNYVSVRERTGLGILRELGIENGVNVVDPVFLLDAAYWRSVMLKDLPRGQKPYILVCDFDRSETVQNAARALADRYGYDVYTIYKNGCEDRYLDEVGPLEFISYIESAAFVLSNSFHATAFSMILHKPFMTFDRCEHLNSRIHDLLLLTGLSGRAYADDPIDWDDVDARLSAAVMESEAYINKVTGEKP